MDKKYKWMILLIVFFLGLGIFLIISNSKDIKNLFINHEEKTNNNLNNNIDKNNKDDSNNPYQKQRNYKQENLNRYVAYKNKNVNLNDQEVVTRVNIGLDYDFYDYIKDTDMTKGNLILTNKYLKLSSNYEPNDLEEIDSKYFISGNLYVREMRKEAHDAFELLSQASIDNGTPVYGQSAYREYSQQEALYQSAVNNYGVQAADSDTARPGHSEHQTGLTIDVSSNKYGNMLSFHKTDSFKWMQDNAHKYGFILRYPKGYEDIHGFVYESWHYRYVGIEVATDMHDKYPNLTFDEYYYMFIDNN